MTGSSNHFADFIDAVRTREAGDLTAEINEGRVSAGLCHAANVSYQSGRKGTGSELLADLGDHEVGRESMERMIRHLEANEIDLEQPSLTIGPWLEIDPQTEQFSSSAANQQARREARGPYTHESLQ